MPNLFARQASRLEENLYRLLVADSLRAYRIALACLLVLVLAATALLFFTGAVHQRLYPCDHAILLDAGWRLLHGQRPHLGFFTTGGGVTYLPVLLGLVVGGPTVSALAYGSAIFLPILGLWSWWLARRRLPAMAALGFAAMVGGLEAGVFPLGCQGWCGFSYAMQYNRFGWSLVCMLGLTMFVRPRQVPSRGREGWEGVSSGLLLGLLILLKVAYAGAAVVIVVLGLLLYRRKIWFWLGIAVSCLGMAAAYAFYMHGDVVAFWRDMSGFVAGQGSESIFLRIARAGWSSLLELWALGLIVLLGLRPIFAGGQSREAATCWLKAVAAAAVCVGLGIVVTAGNAQGCAVPLFVVACVVVMETFQRLTGAAATVSASSSGPPLEAAHLRLGLGWLAAGLAAATFLVPDFGSIVHSSALKLWRAPRMETDLQVDSPVMKGMSFPKQDGDADELADAVLQFRLHAREHVTMSPREYAIWINDGLQLLRGRTDGRSRVFAMAFCNPFPFALQLPSPKATPICMAWGVNMNEAQYLPAERLFEDVTHLMVSKPHSTTNAAPWKKAYGAYIGDHFVLAGESDLWLLYTRRPD